MSGDTCKSYGYINREELIDLLDTLVVKYGDEKNEDIEYGIILTIHAIHEKLPELRTYCSDKPIEFWDDSSKDNSLKTLCEMADKYNIEITIDGSLGRYQP